MPFVASSYLLLVAMPGATSSCLLLVMNVGYVMQYHFTGFDALVPLSVPSS